MTERQKRIIVAVILLATIVIANIPLLSRTALWGADFDYHLFRIKGIADGLENGQFPVRMQTVQLHGYGYPNSVMYPDALLYIPAVLNVLGLSVVHAYQVFAVAFNALSVLVAYVCFKRIFSSRKIGILAGTLWSLSAYRLSDVYPRGAVAEWLAIFFFPVLALGVYEVFRPDTGASGAKRPSRAAQTGRRRSADAPNWGWLLCAAAATGIINSHVLSTEMTVIAFAPAIIVLLVYNHALRVWLRLLAAGVGTLLLSAGFLVPFLDYTLHADLAVFSISAADKVALATGKALEPGRMFLLFSPMTQFPESSAFSGQLPYSLGWATMGFAFLWFVLLTLVRRHDGTFRTTLRWGVPPLVAGMFCAWLTTTFFPWSSERLRPITAILATVQFPARFTSFVVLAMILLGGLGFRLLAADGQFARYANIVFAVLLVFGLAEGGVTVSTYMTNAKALAPFEQVTMAENNGLAGAEYLPKGTDVATLEERYPAGSLPKADDGVTVTDFSKTGTTVTFAAAARRDGEVVLPLLAYPHYVVETQYTGSADCTLTRTDSATNLLAVKVPRGFDGTVRVRFREPLAWKLAFACSWISAIGMAVGGVIVRRRHRTRAYGE
ncbi:hypothetical protein [Bifidobacterium parmae]|uniref:hypothetical protein n=1 Tax=Bifidobacterium parmae TaxID=361854 RepID=UPI0010549DD9|nr:hypothetical protein [Bifidobacterium parmae]